jgi:hypothetical protein
LSLYLLPTGYFLVKRVIAHMYRRSSKDIDVTKARTKAEREKFADLYEKKRAWSHLFTTGFLINLALFVAGCYIVSVFLGQLEFAAELASFDPFEILGVEEVRYKAFHTHRGRHWGRHWGRMEAGGANEGEWGRACGGG